jgi:hypothetical protein
VIVQGHENRGSEALRSRLRLAQGLLVTDSAVLFTYGAVSLLFVPGGANESYLSPGRLVYGVLPIILGLGSLVCAVWLASVPRGASAS